MAIINLHTRSKCLGITTEVVIIIPDIDQIKEKLSNMKVLYLLHGYSDDATMWLRRTRIEKYAEDNHVIVVCPSAINSYYMNDFGESNYEDYIAIELPKYLNDCFNFTNKKEYKMIAGLSMGGGGAMRIGLKYSNEYFAIGSFSGTLVYTTNRFLNMTEEKKTFYLAYRNEMNDADNSYINTLNLISKDIDCKLIYVSCGDKDSLYQNAIDFINKSKEVGMNVTYYIEEGIGHSWDFWDREVNHFLKLALDKDVS